MNKKILIIAGVILVFLITLGALIFFNRGSKKNNSQIGKNSQKFVEPAQGIEGKGLSNLPVVDQAQLKKKYQEDIRQIFADLENEINIAGGINNLSSEKIKNLKNRAIQEVVPTAYREVHLNFILAMGMIINGDFNKAQIALDDIKKKI